jgi:hypothetical protein
MVNILLNIFFVLLIKREMHPHHARLLVPKMRDAHNTSTSHISLKRDMSS